MNPDPDRFDKAVRLMDALNATDPRTEMFEGRIHPKELIFSQRVAAWIERLVDEPSEALRLAAHGHTLCRWKVARDDFDKGLVGYRYWRNACADRHAEETTRILRDVGYDEAMIDAVRDLTLKKNWPAEDEALALEDADCLAFLELKLKHYLDEWTEEKTIDILAKTARKMTPAARTHVMDLALSDREKELIQKALS